MRRRETLQVFHVIQTVPVLQDSDRRRLFPWVPPAGGSRGSYMTPDECDTEL